MVALEWEPIEVRNVTKSPDNRPSRSRLPRVDQRTCAPTTRTVTLSVES